MFLFPDLPLTSLQPFISKAPPLPAATTTTPAQGLSAPAITPSPVFQTRLRLRSCKHSTPCWFSSTTQGRPVSTAFWIRASKWHHLSSVLKKQHANRWRCLSYITILGSKGTYYKYYNKPNGSFFIFILFFEKQWAEVTNICLEVQGDYTCPVTKTFQLKPWNA